MSSNKQILSHFRYIVLGIGFTFVLNGFCFVSCNTEDNKEFLEEKHEDIEETPNNTTTENGHNPNDNDSFSEQNLLTNGGLEKWSSLSQTYDLPTGWYCHNNINVKKNHNVVFEGHYSARMQSQESGSTARIDQLISVIPGHKIRIRFHYYIEQWKSKGARTYCYFRTGIAEKYNISAEKLQSFYDNNTYNIIRGGGYGLSYLPNVLNNWQFFDETIVVPPESYYFVFGINSYYGTIIYIDDCYINSN